jgi:hypothetical protein
MLTGVGALSGDSGDVAIEMVAERSRSYDSQAFFAAIVSDKSFAQKKFSCYTTLIFSANKLFKENHEHPFTPKTDNL